MSQEYDINLDDKYGQLTLIDVAEAAAHQGFTVPKGVMHKTSAPRRTVVVMVEPADVAPTGDA